MTHAAIGTFLGSIIYLDATATEQETDLLGSGVPSGDRYFDGNGHDARLKAAIEGAKEVDRIVVWVD